MFKAVHTVVGFRVNAELIMQRSQRLSRWSIIFDTQDHAFIC